MSQSIVPERSAPLPVAERQPTRTSMPRLFFTLGVLLAINTINFFDRNILAAVQEKFRKEWNLTDSDLGWLGTAFILLYAVVGLPLGRLADVGRRRWILAAGVGLWSLLTLGSGLAWNFASLFVFRLGVGIGEASCAPACGSLIGDLVSPKWRARAMSVFMIGLPLGLAISFPISGVIAEKVSWQAAFFVAGIPGLLLAVAALFVADPPRGAADLHGMVPPPAGDLPFLRVVRRVLAMPTMWWIIASGALHNFNMYALGTFIASLFKRYHAVTVKEAGELSGLVYGFGGLGIFLGGWLGDLAFRRGVSGRLHVAWIALAAAIPFLLLALAAPRGHEWACAVWLLPGCLLLYTYYGTVYTTIQDIIEPRLRGTAIAIYFFAMYLLGAALGPVATGWVSDYCARRIAAADGGLVITESHKAFGLHEAMYLIPILDAALVIVLIAASRTVTGDFLREQKRKELSATQGT